MNLKKVLPLCALAALCLTSCGTDDPAKDHLRTKIGNSFYFATTEAGDTLTGDIGDIYFDFDDENTKAKVSVQSVMLPSGSANFVFDNVGYTVDSHGNRSFSGTAKTDDGRSLPLEFSYFPTHGVDAANYDGAWLSLTTADGTRVSVFPRVAYGFGATETVNTAAQPATKFVSADTYYLVELRPDSRTASVAINKAAFAEGMPALGEMTFLSTTGEGNDSDIALKLSHDGYRLEAATIIPSLAGVPQPKRIVTAFSAEASMRSNRLDIGFTCMRVFTVNSEVTALYQPNDMLWAEP